MLHDKREYFINDAIIASHLDMINDGWRNEFFRTALSQHAKNKVVLDVGTGTGIMAFYALSLGARFVYAVERNPKLAKVAHQVLLHHFDQSQFKVICGDFFSKTIDIDQIDQPVDVLVSELVGPGLFDQGQLEVWHCAQKFLNTNAVSIPDRLSCDIWIWDRDRDAFGQSMVLAQGCSPSFLKKNKYSLFPDQCLDADFVKSLVYVDSSQDQSQNSSAKMHWALINAIKTSPSRILKNIVSRSFVNVKQPNFDYVFDPIWFDIDLEHNTTIAIINQVHFEKQTILIKDARYMPWRMNPMFALLEPGKYRVNYNNQSYQPNSGQEWTCQKL